MKTQPPTRIRLASCLATAALLMAGAARADYQSAVLTDAPLAYYPLSVAVDPTGTTATDLSGHGNNGTYNGTDPEFNSVTGPSPYIPNALSFDGFSSFVDLGTGANPSLLNFGGPITLEAWAQPANPSQSLADILAKGYDSSYGYDEIALRLNGGRFEGSTYDGSNSRGAGGGTPSTDWAYVVATYDGANWKFYFNGKLAGQGADTVGALNFPTPWHIGSGSADGAGRMFNGNLCQVALYNYGLSADAVFAHYFAGKYGVLPSNSIPIILKQPVSQTSFTNGAVTFGVTLLGVLPTTNQWYKNGSPIAGQTNLTLTLSNLQAGDIAAYSVKSGNSNGSTNSASVNLTLQTISPYDKTVVADSPLAYYPLDSAIDSLPLAQDFSGNGNYGVYMNLDPAANTIAGPTAAIPNALNFNGSSAYVDLSQGSQAQLLNFAGPISLEAWVQPANSTSFGDIVAKGYDASSYQESTLRVNGPYGANYYASSGSAAVSGGQQNTSWTHVILTSDGARCSLFINGAVAQSTGDTGGSQLFNDAWAIGNGTSAGSTRFFNGNICQVAIYNHGLSTNQVLQHYYMGAFGSSPSNFVPVIYTQPQPQSVYSGATATFSVTVIGVLPTTNLWFKNGNPLVGQTNATLILPNVQSIDAANYSVVVGNSIGKTNSAAVSLTVLASADSLVWTITNNTSVWDSGASANWVNLANSQQVVFNTGDQVLFDDTPGVPTTVYVSGTVSPSVITVNSDNNNFSLNDSGGSSITGSGSLVKKGSSTLSLLTPFSLTGSVNISGGVVYVGNYAFTAVSAITITNNSTMDFGGGQLTGPKPISISGTGFGGEGALYNSSYEIYSGNSLNITLTGDASFGGTSRWDLGSGSSISGAHKLTVNRANSGVYNEWDTVNVATNVGDIELAVGKLGIKNMDATFGNPNSNLIVDDSAEADFWSGGCNRSLHILSNGKVQVLSSPADFTTPNVTLEDNSQFYVYGGSGSQIMDGTYTFAGVAHILMGDANRLYTNVLTGPGGFLMDAWNHQMILSASNTYSGPTIIGNGPQVALVGIGSISHSSPIFLGGANQNTISIDASGRTDQTFTLASGQTLAGIGSVVGSLVVAPGATLSPSGTNTTIGTTVGANPAGTIAASGSITLGGTTVIKLSATTNDMVQAGTSLTYGGTLNLADITGAGFAAGNSFQVFGAASYSGAFASITPPTPGAGLAWDLSQLGSGKINVVSASAQPLIRNTRIAGGSLIFSGTGGSSGGSYYVLSTTNLVTGPWVPVLTNQFDASGNFSVTNALGTGTRQQFYRVQE